MHHVGWIVTQVKRLCVCLCASSLRQNNSGETAFAILEIQSPFFSSQYQEHIQTIALLKSRPFIEIFLYWVSCEIVVVSLNKYKCVMRADV